MTRDLRRGLVLVALLLSSLPAFADETAFYTMNERWKRQGQEPGQTKGEAIADAFSQAFSGSSRSFTGAPVPPTLTMGLDQAAAAGVIELEQGQSLLLKSSRAIVKFIATDEGIVVLETVDASTLRVYAANVGPPTYVHVWDEAGRKTLSLRVRQPRIVVPKSQLDQIAAAERSRPFKIEYNNRRGAFYQGRKAPDMGRSSYDFIQSGSFYGDTPYGELSGLAETQNERGRAFLTNANVTLRDGKVGNWDNFNAIAGDSYVVPDLMVFPSTRMRGAALEHWDDDKRVKWAAFRGRKQTSIIGTLTPGFGGSERTLDDFVTGGTLDFEMNERVRTKAGYYQGSGRDRDFIPTKHGVGTRTEVDVAPHMTVRTELDNDSDRFAQKHAFLTTFEKFRLKNEFRDISDQFFAITGTPAQQGEVGVLTQASAQFTPQWSATASHDIFRDRLIFNPEDPKRPNEHYDFSTTFLPSEATSVSLNFQDLDDTGRIGPTHLRSYGGQVNQRVQLGDRRATLYARYQNRHNKFLTNAINDYLQDQVVVGFYTQLFWGVGLSVQKEWNLLREPLLDRRTHPQAMTYTLDWSRQIADWPVFLDARLRIRDEEETESLNSFMTGEDQTEFSGGVRYRPSEDFEVFLNGSFTNYVPESLNVVDERVEAQFLTGIHYIYDTGLRWSTVGNFQGHVFKDVNGDGVRQPGEPGMPGQVVRAPGNREAVTDESGYYEIKSVAGRKASLMLEDAKIPAGYVPTGDVRKEVEIAQGKTQTLDFGLMPRSELAGLVFNDLDGDGKPGTGEPGVKKVKITLEDGKTAFSNAQGAYSFPGVAAGEHTAALSYSKLPEGYLPSDVPTKKIKVFEGVRYELNFPLRAVRVVSGRVFLDADGNGRPGPNEMPLARVKVKLGPLAASTDDEGYFIFENVPPGRHPLDVDAEDLPARWPRPEGMLVEMTAEPKTVQNADLAVRES